MLNLKTFIVLLHVCTLYNIAVFANTTTDPNDVPFINNYSAIAVLEMHRSGIPASITLGQAIIESGWGKSELAQGSNNFFGIKCKSTWTGKRFMYKDDDYDHNGKLTDSCFRVYETIEASFRDHTDFLVNRPYYKQCFEFAPDDYVNWAIALQQAGYATAHNYAVKLIDIIEKYNLHYFDKNRNSNSATASIDPSHTQHRFLSSPVQRIDPIMQPASVNILPNKTEITTSVQVNHPIKKEHVPTPPPAVLLAENYIPTYRNQQLDTRSPEIIQNTPAEDFSQNKNVPDYPSDFSYSTYFQPIQYRPKSSHSSKR